MSTAWEIHTKTPRIRIIPITAVPYDSLNV